MIAQMCRDGSQTVIDPPNAARGSSRSIATLADPPGEVTAVPVHTVLDIAAQQNAMAFT
jgi:hypothetical protein